MKSSFHTLSSAAVIVTLALAGAAYAQQGAEQSPNAAQGPRAGQQHEGHGAHAQGRGHGMGHGMGGHRMGAGMGQCGGEDHAAMHQGMSGPGNHEHGGAWGGSRPKQP